MPIYSITNKESTKTRLVQAKTAAGALSHVAASEYSVSIIRKPETVVELIASGITVEQADTRQAAEQIPLEGV